MDSKSALSKLIGIVIVTMLLGYALFRFYPLLAGPHIKVVFPSSVYTTLENFVDIQIETDRVTILRIQGDDIDIQNSGTTIKRIYLSRGINTVKLYSEDKYGVSKSTSLSIIKK